MRQDLTKLVVVEAHLDGNRSLTCSRKPLGRLEKLLDALTRVEPDETGRCENRCMYLSRVHFFEAGRDVSAKLDDLQIGSRREKKRPAPQTRCSDSRSRRDRGEIIRLGDWIHDQNVARIFPLEDCAKLETVGQLHREVLQRVDAAIHFLFRQCDFQLVREEALGADLAQRLVELLVSRGLERHELAREAPVLERSFDDAGLTECELRRARRDADDALCHLSARSTAAMRPSVVDSSASAINSMLPP